MAVDLATLALKVEALEVDAASKKLDNLTAAGGRTEKAAGGMSTAFRALGAALAAVQLTNMIKESALMAARYETMGAAMVTVGNNAGYTGSQMAEYEKRLRATGIAMIESRETLTKMAASHIDLARATDLARIAQDAAVVGNINSSEAFDRMINGIRSAEVEVLRGIGLNVNFEQSYAKLADQLGKNAKDLTESEKLQARVNVTMAAGAGIAGTYEAAMGTAGKMLNSMQRYADDLKVSLGAAFGPAVTLLVDQMTGALKDANAEVRDGQSTIDAWGVKFRSAIISIEAELIRLSMLIDKVGGTMTAVLTGAGELIDVAMNIKGAVSDMYTGVDTGWAESELTKIGKTWNKVYEDRYKAGDKSLQALADLEYQLTNEVQKGGKAQEETRIKAGLAARTQQELDNKKSVAAKEAEASSKKARSAAEAAAKASAQEYQSILDSLEPVRVAQEEYNKALAVLNKMDPTHETERYKDALEELNKTTKEGQELEEHRAEIMGDLEDYERQVAQARMTDAERQIDDINRQTDALIKYGYELAKLDPKYKALAEEGAEAFGERARKQIEDITDNADEMGKMFEDVAKNIQSAFAGMFEDMLDGSGNILDSLGDMFKKLLAQMATMAIANPIIVPIVTTIGTGMGLSTSNIASTLGMDTSQISAASGMGGISSLFSSGSLQGMGVSALATIGGFAQNIGMTSVGNIAMEAGTWLNGLSSGLADGLMGGLGSLATSLLSGQGLNEKTGMQAVGSSLGAMSGLGVVGSVLGGFVGSLVGDMFGTGPDTFGPQYMANDVGVNYSATTGMTPTTIQYTGGDTDSQIAKVYAEQMRSIQTAFDEQVTAMAEALPDEISSAMLASLSSANLKKILNDVSGQEINVSDAASWMEGVAEAYSEGLIAELGKAYGTALSSFISTNGAEGLVGDSAAWGMLTEAVKQNITDSFQSAAATIAGGDIETGLSTINSVTNAIAAIESAMAPITEIIATDGLTEYEKSIRSINIQFDNYAAALKSAGVDMEKYTDLEKARGIALAQVADQMEQNIKSSAESALSVLQATASAAESALSVAESNLRDAYSAEQQRLDDQHATVLDGLTAQMTTAQDAVSKLGSLTSTLRTTLQAMNLETQAFVSGRREEAQATLQATLAAARNGQLDPSVDLSGTLSVLQESSTDMYSSFADYQRDYWQTYLSIAELEDISGKNLTEAQQTVDLLNRQIDAENRWYETETDLLTQQLEALLGLNTSILPISTATSQYQAAAQSAAAANANVASASGSAAFTEAQYYAQKYEQLQSTGAIGSTINGIVVNTMQDMVQVFANAGLSVAQHYELYGKSEGLTKPSFAVGTDYVPNDMTANIHQGERITPAAYNRSDATNAEIVAILKDVVSAVRATGTASVKANEKVADILDAWDYDGMPEARTV